MTEKTKYIIRKTAKLALTSPIWAFFLILGGISYSIGILGVLIQGIGKSIKSGGQCLDNVIIDNLMYPGSLCYKMAEWVNK